MPCTSVWICSHVGEGLEKLEGLNWIECLEIAERNHGCAFYYYIEIYDPKNIWWCSNHGFRVCSILSCWSRAFKSNLIMNDSPSPLFLTSEELKFKVLANDHSKVRKPITRFQVGLKQTHSVSSSNSYWHHAHNHHICISITQNKNCICIQT